MSGLASPKNEAKFALDLRDPTRFAIAASPSQKMAAGGGGAQTSHRRPDLSFREMSLIGLCQAPVGPQRRTMPPHAKADGFKHVRLDGSFRLRAVASALSARLRTSQSKCCART